MSVTLNQIREERDRLNELEKKAWSEFNQLLGAKHQLEAIIAEWEKPEPAPPPKPECPTTSN